MAPGAVRCLCVLCAVRCAHAVAACAARRPLVRGSNTRVSRAVCVWSCVCAQHAGDAGSVQKQMEDEGVHSTAAVNAAVAAKKAEVVDLLVGYATKVNA